MTNPMPNPQDPNDPMYQFIDTQPADEYPVDPEPVSDSSLSHFTVRQFIPTGITAALPIVVTAPAHGLINGEAIRATQFIVMPFANATGMEQINNKLFTVQQATTNTFQLYDTSGFPVDGRTYTPYIGGGQFTLTGPALPVVNPSHFPPPGVPPFPPV